MRRLVLLEESGSVQHAIVQDALALDGSIVCRRVSWNALKTDLQHARDVDLAIAIITAGRERLLHSICLNLPRHPLLAIVPENSHDRLLSTVTQHSDDFIVQPARSVELNQRITRLLESPPGRPCSRTMQSGSGWNGDSPLPRSASERWARLVLMAIRAQADFKTLEGWATISGVSLTSLRETCRLAGIRPHHAKDFARLLRAVMHARVEGCSPGLLLDVSDTRTLRTLLVRGGIAIPAAGPASCDETVDEFLERQQFVGAGHLGLRFIRAHLGNMTQPT